MTRTTRFHFLFGVHPKMLRKRLFLLPVGTAVAAAVVAVAGFADIKREIRLAFGLPKFWVTNFDVEVDRYMQLRCPDASSRPFVLVAGGQSNAANAYRGDTYPEPPPRDENAHTFMFWNGQCFKAQSPVIGSTSGQGSIWPGLADRIQRKTGRDVVIISGAVGGTQIGDWLDQRSGYMARLVEQISAANEVGLSPSIVFWIQGETDATSMVSGTNYAAQQREVIAGFVRAGPIQPNTPWVIFFSTHCKDLPNNGREIEAELHALVAPPGDSLVPGPNITRFGDELRADGCHFNGLGAERAINETMSVLAREGLI